MTPPLLAMAGITKRFPGVVALSDVRITLRPGEVLALMGENGAGKSTLMKILGGVQPPDEGTIEIDGKPVVLDGVRAAHANGIAFIHQELLLASNLDIAANIFLGREGGSLWGPLRRSEMVAKAAELLKRVGLDVPPTRLVSTLTTGQMQMVEVAKAISSKARILIMDEPTASLTAGESAQLFKIVKQLRADGMGIIYISHRMEEVFTLSDRLTVLRDGKWVGDLTRAECTEDKIVAMMVGRELKGEYFPIKEPAPANDDAVAKPFFEIKGLIVPGATEPVDVAVRKGEILGFSGLVGSGRTELMETIFGVRPAHAGTMTLDGQPYFPRSPRDAIRAGVFLAPEDRKRHGLVLPMSVAENTSLPNIQNYNRWGWLDRKQEKTVAQAEVVRMRTKTASLQTRTGSLSGGNQQKIVLGKWLAMNPRLLILDEPTRGIDVGAKAEIYRHMAALAAQGITILMVSSDMEEVIGMSDRVIVMRERRIRGTLARNELSQERIAALMTGGTGGVAAA
jgi:ribose transport system ATP-binding protein